MNDKLREAARLADYLTTAANQVEADRRIDYVRLTVKEAREIAAALASPPEQAGAQAAVLAAASQWWCEREITDWDEAALAKAVIELDGDWEGCPDCDHATCDMPCTPATVSEQIRAVDRHIAQLVHDGKLHAGADYKAPDGWLPMLMPRKRAAPSPSAPLDQQRGQGDAGWPPMPKPDGTVELDQGPAPGGGREVTYGDAWSEPLVREYARAVLAAQPPQAPPAAPWTPEAIAVLGAATQPAAPVGVKDHEVRNTVTDLCAVAVQFHSQGQLRARIQGALFPLLGRFGWKVEWLAAAPAAPETGELAGTPTPGAAG
jgi:hypothetical protein